MKTAKMRDEKDVIQKKLNADVEAKKNLEANINQLTSRNNDISSQEGELHKTFTVIINSIAKHEDEVTCLHDELDKIIVERERSV